MPCMTPFPKSEASCAPALEEMLMLLFSELPMLAPTSFLLYFLDFFHHSIDVSEVATFLIVVEAITHDEVVRDFHHGVVDVEIHL